MTASISDVVDYLSNLQRRYIETLQSYDPQLNFQGELHQGQEDLSTKLQPMVCTLKLAVQSHSVGERTTNCNGT